MLYILTGRDEFSLHEALRELEKSIGQQALLAVNTTTLEGQHLTLNQLKAVGETAPFMGEKRLVIIEGLMVFFVNEDFQNFHPFSLHNVCIYVVIVLFLLMISDIY